MSYRLDDAIWEFTLKCNLDCEHCGSSAGEEREGELTTEECYEVCEDLAELGCENVCLMGGEPFMREDWYEVAKYIQSLGMDLSFVSNGLLIPEVIDKLEKLDTRVVGISLDGMKRTHESIRGKNTFKRTIDAVDLLNDRGIQTTIITTISTDNFDDLQRMMAFLKKKDVNWQIQVAEPLGNFNEEMLVSREDFYSSALFIAKHGVKGNFEEFPVVGAHCFGYNSEILPGEVNWNGCEAGISSIGITSNGNIVGCLSMGQDRFIEGNVKEDSLVKIWDDEGNFTYNRDFEKADLGPNCNDCPYGEKCKGGCNSMSYTITGRLHNDPYCFHKIEEEILEMEKDGNKRGIFDLINPIR